MERLYVPNKGYEFMERGHTHVPNRKRITCACVYAQASKCIDLYNMASASQSSASEDSIFLHV